MNNLKYIQNMVKAFFIVLLSSSTCLAAETTETATTASSFTGNDIALYVLGGVIVLFVFIIFVLSNAVKIANKGYLKKLKESSTTAVKSISLLISFTLLSSSAFAQEAEKATAPSYSFQHWDVYLLSFIVFLLFIVVLVLVRTLFILMGIKKEAAEVILDAEGKPSKVRTWFQKFNETVPIEDEAALDMSHDYDGIRELDNKIPSWWTWAMVSLVLFSVVYLYRMFISETLPDQFIELAKANEIAEVQKAEYLAKGANNVDENTVKMLGEADIAIGANLYAKNCIACHGDKGQGGVGPNLADPYWIHKGGIKDIFYSLKYGWQEKGMKAWKDDFSPMQIAQISSFVKSLNGTNPPGGKDKQGELYVEEGLPAIDSTTVVAVSDSVKVKS